MQTLKEALGIAHDHGERFYLAELYRLKGQLLLQQAAGTRGKIAPTERPNGNGTARNPSGWSPLHTAAALDSCRHAWLTPMLCDDAMYHVCSFTPDASTCA